MKKIVTILCAIVMASPLIAQVKIGDNPNTINANSLLELESTNKGFLPPRVTLTSLTSVSPLTGTVPAGMLVYNNGGSLTHGYYYWSGTDWKPLSQNALTTGTKTANATLSKTEAFILASNDITLTLPSITTVDNGVTITIKNIGTHTDFIKVKGNGTATIDGKDSSMHTRWISRTYIAQGGNWLTKNKETGSTNIYEVSPEGSWTSLEEALEFLDEHMSHPSIIKLSGGSYEISTTQVINLDFPLTIQGASYGAVTIEAASGLAGKPMFRCLSETYFKMLAFDATTLSGYGNSANEDAIQLETSGEYFEIKDCNFTRFNKTIVAESNVEVWIFEVDINDAVSAGVEVAAGSTDSVSIKISEVDFIKCAKGINMASGNKAAISILNCTFYNGSVTDVGINYVPATFTAFASMFITNNAWNNSGTFFSGFDFSRTDGRDAKAFIQNNAGEGDKNPTCRINVNNNATTTGITTAGTLYKAVWTNTSSFTTKWTIDNNKITYQAPYKRSAYFIITGNISVDNPGETVTICITKNGVTTTRIGETDLRLASSGQPYQFSTVIYLENVLQDDYFELYCTTASNNRTVTFRDVQWFTETK